MKVSEARIHGEAWHAGQQNHAPSFVAANPRPAVSDCVNAVRYPSAIFGQVMPRPNPYAALSKFVRSVVSLNTESTAAVMALGSRNGTVMPRPSASNSLAY